MADDGLLAFDNAPPTCPACGNDVMHPKYVPAEVKALDSEHTVDLAPEHLLYACERCGFELRTETMTTRARSANPYSAAIDTLQTLAIDMCNARGRANESLREFARRTGIPHQTLARWERDGLELGPNLAAALKFLAEETDEDVLKAVSDQSSCTTD
jgi:DNA-binding transcriptional regulator YiaG